MEYFWLVRIGDGSSTTPIRPLPHVSWKQLFYNLHFSFGLETRIFLRFAKSLTREKYL